jgi:uncharacterized protein (TIRG00374 family)
LLILQSLLGVGLLAAWAWAVDLRAVGRTLSSAMWQFVALVIILSFASTLVRAVRWRLILRPVARVSLHEIWFISLASSLINFVIPLRTGEVARSLLLKQRHQVPISVGLSTVAVDRSLDLMAVLLEGVLGALIGIHLDSRMTAVLILGSGLLLGFAAAVLVALVSGERAIARLERLMPRFLGDRLRERVVGISRGLVAGFAAIGRRPSDILAVLLLSLISALIDAAGFYFLFVSLGTIVAPAVVMTGYALYVLTFLIPGAPGYVGSAEAFGSLVFGSLGVGSALAASTIVLAHALNAVVLAVGGGISIWGLGLRPGEAVRSFISSAEPTLGAGNSPES